MGSTFVRSSSHSHKRGNIYNLYIKQTVGTSTHLKLRSLSKDLAQLGWLCNPDRRRLSFSLFFKCLFNNLLRSLVIILYIWLFYKYICLCVGLFMRFPLHFLYTFYKIVIFLCLFSIYLLPSLSLSLARCRSVAISFLAWFPLIVCVFSQCICCECANKYLSFC